MPDQYTLSCHSKVIIERARLRELAWGDEPQISAVLRDKPDGFDVVMGADVVYVQEFIQPLFQTARRVLKLDYNVRPLPPASST